MNHTTALENTDLRGTSGFRANGQRIKGARFKARANDPYSTVRRIYTGPLLMFNLVFVIAFFAPYILKAALWTGIDRAESSSLAQSVIDGATGTGVVETNTRSVALIVLGYRPGWWGTVAVATALIFILYNVLRAIMTWWLSQVRDAEERSGYLPEIKQYWWCYLIHKYFMAWAFWLAVISFTAHAIVWAFSSVRVPA